MILVMTQIQSNIGQLGGIVGSPFSKIALVGGVGFLGFLLVGLFMNSIMSPSNAKQLTVTSDDQQQLFLNPMVDPKDAEIAKFKTDLALGSQLSAGKSKTLSPTNSPKSDSKVSPKALSETNAAKQTELPPVSPVRNLSAPPLEPIPMRQVMSQPTPVMLPPRNFSASPPEAKNPADEWQRLASIGSYGNLAAPTEMPRAIAVSPTAANNSSIPTIEKPPVNSLTNYLAQAEKSLPKSTSANTLLVGTTAKAALKTSVVFSTDGSRIMGSAPGVIPKFIVTLQEPITTADGKPSNSCGCSFNRHCSSS